VEADENDVVAQEAEESRSLIELVWRERLPLGMNLLTNDESGQLKVVDFPRGSQARAVCEKRKLNPSSFQGSTIVAVNGTEYTDTNELFDALRDPSRPKTVRFQLEKIEEVERVRSFVEASRANDDNKKERLKRTYVPSTRVVEVSEPGELGLEFSTAPDNVSLFVSSFLEHPDGIVYAAEKTGRIRVGDFLVSVQSARLMGNSSSAIELLEKYASQRPLALELCDPYVFTVKIPKAEDQTGLDTGGGPDELVLDDLPRREGRRRVGITSFLEIPGMAESSGILIGDHLIFVNGQPVGAGCRWMGIPMPGLDEVYGMLRDESKFPMGLTFARPHQLRQETGPLRDDEADTFCVTADNKERIGCLFDQTPSGDIHVRDFYGIAGLLQRSILARAPHYAVIPSLAVESIQGELVPSYATVDMVRSAICRAWKDSPELRLTVCNDELRDFVKLK